jgi:hypothetical protein
VPLVNGFLLTSQLSPSWKSVQSGQNSRRVKGLDGMGGVKFDPVARWPFQGKPNLTTRLKYPYRAQRPYFLLTRFFKHENDPQSSFHHGSRRTLPAYDRIGPRSSGLGP